VIPWYASVAFSPFLLAFAVNHIDTSPVRPLLEVRALGVLGLISYSVYLWQQPFYKYPLPYHLGLAGALAAGAASFLHVRVSAKALAKCQLARSRGSLAQDAQISSKSVDMAIQQGMKKNLAVPFMDRES